MSAKKAKQVRKELRGEKFPALAYKVTINAKEIGKPYTPGYRFFPKMTYEVEVNHVRRIRRLAASTGMSLQAATAQHKHWHKIPHVRTV